MELFVIGILTGLLACVLAMLVRCAYWYEITHPEDDFGMCAGNACKVRLLV